MIVPSQERGNDHLLARENRATETPVPPEDRQRAVDALDTIPADAERLMGRFEARRAEGRLPDPARTARSCPERGAAPPAGSGQAERHARTPSM